ncbi:hypothetical protein FF1_027090 [Malus domestica]|uniref:Dihydrolipoamide acetyltransferase component of pyruvate dehydrogenase complex n=1 Tax=Malus domestica TaxID=3750 RepID=A0A498KLP7_MALDO|nr:hypothetical protein DVH24_026490 [Malus domestica]
MPALSSTMTEGKIVSWVKSEGNKLSKNESVVDVESDKADLDVETFSDGYLASIMVEKGGVAAVGSAIAILAEIDDEITEAKAKAGSSSAAPMAPAPAAAAPEPLLKKIPNNMDPAVVPKAAATMAAVASTHPASEGGKRIVASPYVKKLANDLNVDLAVVGSGPLGRIMAKDVEAFAAQPTVAAVAELSVWKSAAAVVEESGIQLGSMVPFTTMQGAVSRNMLGSLSVPTFRVGYTITTDALDALYKKISTKLETTVFRRRRA